MSVNHENNSEQPSREQWLLHAIVDACPVPMALNDDAGNVLFLNAEFMRSFGYTRQDIPTRADWWPKAYPDPMYRQLIADTWETHLAQAISQGWRSFRPVKAHIRCKDGSERVANISGAPLGDAYDGIHLVVLADITETAATAEALAESHKLLQTVIDTLPTRVFWKDRNFRYLGSNLAFAADAGLDDPQAVIGRTDYELGWRSQANLYRSIDRGVMDSGEAKLGHEELLTTPQGERLWLRTSKAPLRNTADDIIGVVGIYDDITTEKTAIEALKANERHYRTLFETIPVGVVYQDASGQITSANPAACRILGLTLDQMRGVTSIDPRWNTVHEDGSPFPGSEHPAMEALRTGQAVTDVIMGVFNPLDERHSWINVSAVPLFNEATGELEQVYASFQDISHQRDSAEVIWRQANFDALTGLPNRNMLRDRLQQAVKQTRRDNRVLALMFIDLDRFKEVNDTLGHAAGDALLVEAARRIRSCVRETDTAARLGGDEFTVVLSQLPDSGLAEEVAQTLISRLEMPFHVHNEVLYVSASIGITLFPNDADDIDTLLRNADQAMYVAKAMGRNRVSFFTPALQQAAQLRLRRINDLRGALAANQLRIHFQPIVELNTGQIQKAEALLRWEHPTQGTIYPTDFIPLAEETGLINEIGDWLFLETARWIKRWRESTQTEFQVSINVSPIQFKGRGELSGGNWMRHLKTLGLPANAITVEITEGLLLHADPMVTDKLLEFRDGGIQVAIDDFGTGYSSLAYLKQFNIDILKIDRTFVRDLATDPNDRVLTEAIVMMAHKLGLKVVAEGVETEFQRNLLSLAGCDYAQGYLFSAPLPPEQFEALLDRRQQTNTTVDSGV